MTTQLQNIDDFVEGSFFRNCVKNGVIPKVNHRILLIAGFKVHEATVDDFYARLKAMAAKNPQLNMPVPSKENLSRQLKSMAGKGLLWRTGRAYRITTKGTQLINQVLLELDLGTYIKKQRNGEFLRSQSAQSKGLEGFLN